MYSVIRFVDVLVNAHQTQRRLTVFRGSVYCYIAFHSFKHVYNRKVFCGIIYKIFVPGCIVSVSRLTCKDLSLK
jgi:hypothetical protein